MNFKIKNKKKIEKTIFISLKILTYLTIIILLLIIGFIIKNGISSLSWNFLTEMPRDEMTKGGILPAIVGTFYLMLGSLIISIPVGVITAIYIAEYAKNPKIVKIIRLAINNLAGVPSVIFGLFGLTLFVTYFNFGTSMLSGSLTLGLLNLPIIIRATEESLKTVPKSYREASLALGATKWETIKKIVLPDALPGILTGIILSIGRATGETAPIMFTAAVFSTPDLPSSIFDEIMALPYHIYVLSTAGTHIEQTRSIQYGSALVLILIVLILNLSAQIIRSKYSKKNV